MKYAVDEQQIPQGIKRPSSSDPIHEQSIRKRIRHHRLQVQQSIPVASPLPLQDEAFFQMQLMRSISIALGAAGFEGVKPVALESFRAAVEEYMLRFLSHVRRSMQTCRRTQPVPQDFAYALSRHGIDSSSLALHLRHPLDPLLVQPPLPASAPEEPSPPSLECILGPPFSGADEKARRPWIPSHLPNLPSNHTWQETPVVTKRERDPLKIRERATQEGILAEQALRKLLAASKAGVRKSVGSSGQPSAERQRSEQVWEETIAAVLEEDERSRAGNAEVVVDFGGNSAVPSGAAEKQPATPKVHHGVLVNYDRKYWRHGAATTVS